MIVVKVELWSAITGATVELARATICNTGEGTPARGNYLALFHRGRDSRDLEQSMVAGTYTHRGEVKSHARLKEHVWNLVGKALAAAGYKTS